MMCAFRKSFRKLWHLGAALCAAFLCLHAFAAPPSLDALAAQGEVSLTVALEYRGSPVVKEELTLAVTVTSLYPLHRGTRLVLPEIPGAVLVQRDAFAINSTATDNGITRIVQRWELSLFPQQEGKLRIPPLAAAISLSHPEGAVEGTLAATPASIDVRYPDGIDRPDGWIAATRYRVERELLPQDFRAVAGQALQVRITQSAENLLAMMLPPVVIAPQPGLGIYRHPPRLIDRSQRGEKTAIRIDTYDLVVEKSGNYLLPAWQYRWWNTVTWTLEQGTLNALALSPDGAPSEIMDTGSPLSAPNRDRYIVAAAILLAAVIAAWATARRCSTTPSPRRAFARARHCARRGDATRCARWLYHWLDHQTPHLPVSTTLRERAALSGEPDFAEHVDRVLAAAYGRGNAAQVIADLKLPRPRPTPTALQKPSTVISLEP